MAKGRAIAYRQRDRAVLVFLQTELAALSTKIVAPVFQQFGCVARDKLSVHLPINLASSPFKHLARRSLAILVDEIVDTVEKRGVEVLVHLALANVAHPAIGRPRTGYGRSTARHRRQTHEISSVHNLSLLTSGIVPQETIAASLKFQK